MDTLVHPVEKRMKDHRLDHTGEAVDDFRNLSQGIFVTQTVDIAFARVNSTCLTRIAERFLKA